jgi:hypothetical protein
MEGIFMTQKNIKIFGVISIICFLALIFLNVEILDAISYAVTIAALMDWSYDRFLWRFNPLEKTPKIYGVYAAAGESNYNGHTTYNSTIIIKQNLSSISIVEIMENSCCESVTASVAKTTPNGPWFLYYTYITHPKLTTNDDMHYGTTILYIREDGVLDGSYFTNRNKQTAGNISLRRIKK